MSNPNDNQRLGANQIRNNAITVDKIVDGAVSTDKLQNLVITTPKLGELSVTTSKLQNTSVDSTKLHWDTKLLYDTNPDHTSEPVIKFFPTKLSILDNSTSLTEKIVLQGDGKVGIGVAPAFGLDIISSNGEVRISNSVADTTDKAFRLYNRHYLNTEDDTTLLYANNTSSSNSLSIGGGTSLGNALTGIYFYTASNTTTSTGTLAMQIGGTGVVQVNSGLLYAGLNDNTSGQLRLYGDGAGSINGGRAIFYTASDYDTTYDFFDIDIIQDTLRIQSSANQGITMLGDGSVGIRTDVPTYTLDVAGTVGIDDYIYHNDDANTYLRYFTDQLTATMGGTEMLDMYGISQMYVKINPSGGDVDFQVNSSLGANIFSSGNSQVVVIGGTTMPTDSNLDLFIPWGGLGIWNDVTTNDDNKRGFRFTENSGNLYWDSKTYSGGTINFRVGEGTESGAQNYWMKVTSSNQFVDLYGEVDFHSGLRITGVDSFVPNTAQLYTHSVNGLVITGKVGTTYDLALAESGGSIILANKVGTSDVYVLHDLILDSGNYITNDSGTPNSIMLYNGADGRMIFDTAYRTDTLGGYEFKSNGTLNLRIDGYGKIIPESGTLSVDGDLDLNSNPLKNAIIWHNPYDSDSRLNIMMPGFGDVAYQAVERGWTVTSDRAIASGSLASMFNLGWETANWTGVDATSVEIEITPTTEMYLDSIEIVFGNRNCNAIDYTIEVYEDNNNDSTYQWTEVANVTGNDSYFLQHDIGFWRIEKLRITITDAGDADQDGNLSIATIQLKTGTDYGQSTGYLASKGDNVFYGNQRIISTDSTALQISYDNSGSYDVRLYASISGYLYIRPDSGRIYNYSRYNYFQNGVDDVHLYVYDFSGATPTYAEFSCKDLILRDPDTADSNVRLRADTDSSFYNYGIVINLSQFDNALTLSNYPETPGQISPNLAFKSGGGNFSYIRADDSGFLFGANGSTTAMKIYDTGITSYVDIIQSGNLSLYNNFAAGWAGSGFRLDYGVTNPNTSTLEVNDLWVRHSLHAYELVINNVRSVKGGIVISVANGEIEEIVDNTTPGSEVVKVRDPDSEDTNSFAVDDIILIQKVDLSNTTVTKIIVRTVAAVSTNTVTFSYLGDGPSDSGEIVVGDHMVAIGNENLTTNPNRGGSIYITASDSNSPFMRVKDGVASWTGAADGWTSQKTTKAQMGNLGGYSYEGNLLSGYGLVSENAYLSGEISVGTFYDMPDNSYLSNHFQLVTEDNLYDYDILYNSSASNNLTLQSSNQYYFNGINSSISITNDTSTNYGFGNFSVELEFMLHKSGTIQQLVYHQGSVGYGYDVYVDTDNKLKVKFSTSSGTLTSTGGVTLEKYKRYHLVVSFDRSANAEIYINNSSYDTLDISAYSGTTVTDDGNLYIGHNPDLSYYANISVFKFQEWIFALTSTHVEDLYNELNVASETVSLLRAAMEDNIWTDDTANGNNGTPSNTTLLGTQINDSISPLGNTARLNGGILSGDYLELDSNITVDLTDASITFWAKLDRLDSTDVLNTSDNFRILYGDNYSYNFLDIRTRQATSGNFTLSGEQTDNGALFVNTEVGTADTDWHHYSLVFRDGYTKIYFDGDLIEDYAWGGSPSTAKTLVIRSIGRGCGQSHATYGQFWEGGVSDLRVYNTKLTHDEIKAIIINSKIEGHTTIRGNQITTGILQSNNWGTTTGSYFNLDDGIIKMGGSDTPDLYFDGSTLDVNRITADTGTIGSFNIDGSGLYSGTTITSDGISLNAANQTFFIGSNSSVVWDWTSQDPGDGVLIGNLTVGDSETYAYQFSVGKAGQFLTWDGSQLMISMQSGGNQSTGILLSSDTDKHISTGFAVYNMSSPKLFIGDTTNNLTWDTATSTLLLTGDDTSIELSSNGIEMYANSVKRMQFDPDGSGWLVASDKIYWSTSGVLNVDRITAGDGTIGGFDITSTEIKSSDNSISINSANKRILVGDSPIIWEWTSQDQSSGIAMGYYTDAYKFSIGNSDRFLTWDGSDFTIGSGQGTGTYTGLEITTASSKHIDIGFALYNASDPKLWIGDLTTSMDWNVTTADTLTLTNADLSGVNITGSTFKTSSSGTRIELTDSDIVKFYVQGTPDKHMFSIFPEYTSYEYRLDFKDELNDRVLFRLWSDDDQKGFAQFAVPNGLKIGDGNSGSFGIIYLNGQENFVFTAPSTKNVEISGSNIALYGNVINNHILYPDVALTGSLSSRVITITVKRLDDSSVVLSERLLLRFWFADASYDGPEVITDANKSYNASISLNQGTMISPTTLSNTASMKEVMTDSSDQVQFTVTPHSYVDIGSGTKYLMIEIQGIVYAYTFTIYNNVL